MSLLTIILVVVVVGILLWAVNFIPMDGTIKLILKSIVIIVLIVWLLKVFGLWSYLAHLNV